MHAAPGVNDAQAALREGVLEQSGEQHPPALSFDISLNLGVIWEMRVEIDHAVLRRPSPFDHNLDTALIERVTSYRKIPGSSFMPDEVFALGDKSKFEGR
jgi:hypothetical protein